jgi:hypothetical protein
VRELQSAVYDAAPTGPLAQMRLEEGVIFRLRRASSVRTWRSSAVAPNRSGAPMVSARRLEGQRLHEDGEGEEDVFGIAAARVGKFLRLIQTKRMG